MAKNNKVPKKMRNGETYFSIKTYSSVKTNSSIKTYSSINMPEPDGYSSLHKPRRNYWGNLIDEDTYQEEITNPQHYDYSDYDSEDDHSSYYDSDGYD